jgi:hypothetical protein
MLDIGLGDFPEICQYKLRQIETFRAPFGMDNVELICAISNDPQGSVSMAYSLLSDDDVLQIKDLQHSL